MRKLLVTAAVAALLVVGLGVWIRSAGEATGSIQPASISTHDLHLKTDVKKLPTTMIEDIN